ncbi:MAG: DUF5615 family PIN-like protein [Gammaproteobacteria bacterium]|nr:DUF5615 family PIN-like protein [Gammaproteobacteria bacterium]
MRLFLDECISPQIALALNDEGDHVVLHPRNDGGLGDPDHRVLDRCIDHDLVLVTQNGRDFRNLAARQDIHPGLVVLPNVERAQTEAFLRAALAHLVRQGNPMDAMVNRVLEVTETGEMRSSDLAAINAL